MTYVLEVDFPDWDNELRATHLPEVKVASDGDVTLLRTQEFGRSQVLLGLIHKRVPNFQTMEHSILRLLSQDTCPHCNLFHKFPC